MKATRRIRLGRWLLLAVIIGVIAVSPTSVLGEGGADNPNPGPIVTPDSSFTLSPFGAAVYGSFLVLDAMF
jgi:hypothetical protein